MPPSLSAHPPPPQILVFVRFSGPFLAALGPFLFHFILAYYPCLRLSYSPVYKLVAVFFVVCHFGCFWAFSNSFYFRLLLLPPPLSCLMYLHFPQIIGLVRFGGGISGWFWSFSIPLHCGLLPLPPSLSAHLPANYGLCGGRRGWDTAPELAGSACFCEVLSQDRSEFLE